MAAVELKAPVVICWMSPSWLLSVAADKLDTVRCCVLFDAHSQTVCVRVDKKQGAEWISLHPVWQHSAYEGGLFNGMPYQERVGVLKRRIGNAACPETFNWSFLPHGTNQMETVGVRLSPSDRAKIDALNVAK